MKKIFLFFTLALTGISFGQQLTTYGRYTFEDNTVMPVANFYATKELKPKLDLTVFGLTNPLLGEVLIGLAYSPKPWITIGLSGGLEKSPTVYRLGTSLWVGNQKQFFLGFFEKGDGKQNYFYRGTYQYNTKKKVFWGATAWRFHGVGPLIGYNLSKVKTSFWLAPLRDFEFSSSRIVLGTTIKF